MTEQSTTHDSTDPKARRDVPSDELVRAYRTPPGDRLYAYRDGDEHVVVSRGSEPGDRWHKRVPAERTRVVPGQKLWTIPDNWEPIVTSKREDHKRRIYHVPETGHHIEVSVPTNDWLVDAWYAVKGVGSLTAGPVGELADYFDAKEWRDSHDLPETDTEIVDVILAHWSELEAELEHALEWVVHGGIDQQRPHDRPLTVDRSWTIEFRERVFRPSEVLNRATDLDSRNEACQHVLREMKQDGLFPDYYQFTLGIEQLDDTEHDIRALIEAGASPAAALDYVMVERNNLTQTAWSKEREIDQGSVSKNVSEAKSTLGK